MKLGDKVILRYYFSIVGYNFDRKILNLQLFNNDMAAIEEIRVPLFLAEFGLDVNQKFVKPSTNLPEDHPDKYEVEEHYALWKGEPCEILLSPNFNENGLYTIKYKDQGKTSEKKVAQYLDSIYFDYFFSLKKDEILEGSNVSGRIVLIWDKDGDRYDEVVENSFVLVEQINDQNIILKSTHIQECEI